MADNDMYDFASGLPIPPTSAAASATLPGVMDAGQQAAAAIAALKAQTLGVGHSMIPGPTMAKPIMPQAPMHIDSASAIAQGPFASVGSRKRADTAALFGNINKIVQTAQDRIYQKKVATIQHDFETLGAAIQGYKEAQASGNQDMLQHNAKIINDIVMDPKKSKELSKAFDVNLNPMAEGKGKGAQKPDPSKDALKAAFGKNLQNFQSGKDPLSPQAHQMMDRMPQTMQPNPQFQSYLEGLKAGAYPKAADEMEFTTKVMEVQQKINNNAVTNETKMQMSKNLSEAMLNRVYMQQYGATLRTQMMQLGAMDRAVIMADALKYRADQVLKGQADRTSMMRERLTAAGTDSSKRLLTLMKGLDDAAKKNTDNIKEAKKNHDMRRLELLNKQADGIAMQQRLVNDKAEQLVGIDPQNPPDQKNMGLSDDEMFLFNEIFKDNTS